MSTARKQKPPTTMMSEEDKRKLEDNRPELMEGINLEDGLLFAHLRKREVLTPAQESAIKEPGGNSAKVGKLLDILLKGNSDTLGHFIESLKATGSGHKALAETCFGAGFPATPPVRVADPHYDYARQLAEDMSDRNVFLKTLSQKSKNITPRASLHKVVCLLNIDPKVLVYLVHLVPDVSEKIGRLFIIERAENRLGLPKKPVNFKYYKELLDVVTNAKSKEVFIKALVNAEVSVKMKESSRAVGDANTEKDEDDMDWFDLLKELDKDQSAILLEKTHGFKLCVEDHKSTMSFDNSLYLANEFHLAVAYRYNSSIITDSMTIIDPNIDLPACMLSHNMSGVRVLELQDCTICEAIPHYYSRHEGLKHQPPGPAETSLESVHFWNVKGMAQLRHCQVVTSRPCRLEILSCDDVTVADVKKCFPEVHELQLDMTKVLQPDVEVPIHTSVANKIAEICPLIQEFDQSLERLMVTEYQDLKRGNRSVPQRYEIQVGGITRRNDTLLCEISLCCASAPLRDLLDACSPYLQCRKVKAEECDIQFNVGDTLQARYDSLEELEMQRSSNPVDLAKLLSFCSRSQLMVVRIDNSTLLINDEKMNAIQQMPELETTFTFKAVSVSKPDRTPWNGTDALGQLLRTLFPAGNVDIVE